MAITAAKMDDLFAHLVEPDGVPDLNAYERILVAFSGGADSLAMVLDLLERGVPRDKIELHHHEIDGRAGDFMDWACTPAYCRAVAAALGLRIYFSWRVGGFEGELMKRDARTAPVMFERPDGSFGQGGGIKGDITTREMWPMKGETLMTRWCSSICKIDVMDILITNQPRFDRGWFLVMTGERAEESRNRAKYKAFEPHRKDTNRRTVDVWRSVLRWSKQDVWSIIERWKISPHVAYRAGWGRLSCLACIFGSPNQWATIRAVFPERFALIRDREVLLGHTIDQKRSVEALADRGTPYPAALAQLELCRLAQGTVWDEPVFVDDWRMPAGAFGEKVGPT